MDTAAFAAPTEPLTSLPGSASWDHASVTFNTALCRYLIVYFDYADRQLAELALRLDDFELDRREQLTLGGLPAVALRFTCRSASGPLAQRLVVVEGRRRSLYCFTSTTPRADAAQNDPLFDRILGSVRFPQMAPREGAEEAR